MLDFPTLVHQCTGSEVTLQVLERIVTVESGFNPLAIGVVGGRLARQPVTRDEAVATARYLHLGGWNFSMGLGQINRHNLKRYDLDYETAFEPCSNIRVTALIFSDCLQRASKRIAEPEQALKAAYSCYYSGNFSRGFQPEGKMQQSYVDKIMAVEPSPVAKATLPITVIPNAAPRKPPQSRKAETGQGKISRLNGATGATGVRELRGN